MAIVTNSNQVKWGGRGYLDPKMQPVANLAALPTDPIEVFEGMTVVVLNDGTGEPHDYWRVNGTWVKKENGSGSSAEIQEVKDLVDEVSASIGSGFTSASTVAGAIADLNSAVAGKVDAVPGKGLSSNDYTSEEKAKLASLNPDAEQNVQSDWNVSDDSSDAFIKNKPDLSGFITKDTDELANYYKKSEVYNQGEVDGAIASAKSEVTSAIEQQIQQADYVPGADFQTAVSGLEQGISAATALAEGKQDKIEAGAGLKLENNELSVLVDEATIVINDSGKLHVIGGGGGGSAVYTAGQYISISNDEISVTGITPDAYATKAELADYAEKSDIQDFVTAADVASAVTDGLQGYVKTEDLDDYAQKSDLDNLASKDDLAGFVTSSALTEELADYAKAEDLEDLASKDDIKDFVTADDVATAMTQALQDYVKPEDLEDYAQKSDLEGFVTSSAMTEELADYAKSEDLQDLATKDDIKDFLKEEDVAGFVTETAMTQTLADYAKSEDLEELATKDDIKDFVTASEVEDAVAQGLSAFTEENDFVESDDFEAALAGKQDTLTAGEHISIENNVISATGIPTDHDIETKVDEYLQDKDVVTADVVNDMVSSAVTENIEAKNLVTEDAVENIVGDKVAEYVDAQGYVNGDNVNEMVTTAVTAYVGSQGYVTEGDVANAIADAVEDKQDKLTAGEHIAIENNVVSAYGFATSEEVSSAITESLNGYVKTEDLNEYAKADDLDGFVKSDDIKDFVTADEVSSAMTEVLADYAKTEDLADYAKTEDLEGFIKNEDLKDFVTFDEMSSAMTEELTGYVKSEDLEDLATKDDIKDFVTSDDVAGTIAESLSAFTEENKFVDADDVDAAIATAMEDKQDKLTAGDNITIEDNVISAVIPGVEDITSAMTEYIDEKFESLDLITMDQVTTAITTYVTAQDFATNEDVADAVKDAIEEGEYMTGSEVLSAITTYVTVQDFATEEYVNNALENFEGGVTMEEVNSAITESLSGYAKTSDIADFVTGEELLSAKTEATNAALIGATAWTESQGYAKEQDVLDTVQDLVGMINSAETNANAYTDSAVQTAMAGVTHPAYSIATATPASNLYSATYQLTKDGTPVSGAAAINIPKSSNGKLESDLVTDIALGHVSAGTVFSAGTSFESILRQILTSGGGGGGDTQYFYYGGLATPIDETTGMTEANITANLTRSASAAAAGDISFRVNAGAWQLVVACPATLILDEMVDSGNNIDYTQAVTDNYDPISTTTINGATYNLYYHTFDASFPSRVTFRITFVDA